MKVIIVVEGGRVRYVASPAQDLEIEVVDLDDLHDGGPDDYPEQNALLAEAEAMQRVW
jgi:hypothetical protein